MGARPGVPAAAGGLLDALRAVGATLGDMACVRASLLSIEVREEILRRKQQLMLSTIALLLLHTGLLLCTALVAAFFWETHRLAAMASMTLLYLAGGTALLFKARHDAALAPAPFSATLHELGEDLRALRGAP